MQIKVINKQNKNKKHRMNGKKRNTNGYWL